MMDLNVNFEVEVFELNNTNYVFDEYENFNHLINLNGGQNNDTNTNDYIEF